LMVIPLLICEIVETELLGCPNILAFTDSWLG
jgi:hypothetical protein